MHTRRKPRSPRQKEFKSLPLLTPTFAMLSLTSSSLSCLRRDQYRRSTSEPRSMTHNGFVRTSRSIPLHPLPTADLQLRITSQIIRGPTRKLRLPTLVKHGARTLPPHMPLSALNHHLITTRLHMLPNIRMPTGEPTTAQRVVALCVLVPPSTSSTTAPMVSNPLLARI